MKETPRRRVAPEKHAGYMVACTILRYLLSRGTMLATALRDQLTAGAQDQPATTVNYQHALNQLLLINLVETGSRSVAIFHRHRARLTLGLTFSGWVVATVLEEGGCLSPHTTNIIAGS